MDSSEIQQIQKKFPKIDINVINYVLNTISMGNVQLAIDTLKSLPKDQIDMLAEQFNQDSLSHEQKESIKDFKSICGVTSKTAEKYLRQNAWRLDEAMNAFFNAGGEEAGVIFEENNELKTLFEKYQKCDNLEDRFSYNGVVQFCQDLQIDINKDLSILVICWKLGVKTTYMITKSEFIDELSDLGCKTLKNIVEKIPEWKTESQQKKSSFYSFVYGFTAVNEQEMLKSVAIRLWALLFSQWNKIDSWCKYFDQNWNRKFVSSKLWIELYDFVEHDVNGREIKHTDVIFEEFAQLR